MRGGTTVRGVTRAPAKQARVLSDAEVEDLRRYHLNYLGYKEEYFKVDGKWAR